MSGEDITSGRTADGRSLKETKVVGSSLLRIPRMNIAAVKDEKKVDKKREREIIQGSINHIHLWCGHLL